MTTVAVPRWTGHLAVALQEALRLSQEAFAEQLGVAPRTVAKWHQQPDKELRPQTKGLLDTVLTRADRDAQQRFALLIADSMASASTHPRSETPRRHIDAIDQTVFNDRHVSSALAWLDDAADWSPGTSRQVVLERLAAIEPHELQDRGHLRSRVTQRQVAAALASYYDSGSSEYVLYEASSGNTTLPTSIVTKRDWLDLRLPLAAGNEDIAYTSATSPTARLDEVGATAAAQRLAERVATGAPMVDAPLYRLTKIDAGPRLSGTVGITGFVEYALTLDLLESELVDAIADGKVTQPGSLPLRDRYLPTLASVTNVSDRLCAGGVLALCAIARPGSRPRRDVPDYLVLVQERSGQVLNAAGRLAVIPKSFHQPLVDYRDDAQFFMTLERELEEELFGRTDVDSALDNPRSADPMHSSRLSAPMRWLMDNANDAKWRMECTGFGFNLVSGNFECAALIVVDDEDWWSQFGGTIETNWESDGLRRYSTIDRPTVSDLIVDPAWSNEGLFAMLQGLRRLSELGGHRVDLPPVRIKGD